MIKLTISRHDITRFPSYCACKIYNTPYQEFLSSIYNWQFTLKLVALTNPQAFFASNGDRKAGCYIICVCPETIGVPTILKFFK